MLNLTKKFYQCNGLYNAPIGSWDSESYADLSDTKYRTTDRAFKDPNTLPTPFRLALHLVFHMSSTMLLHHHHLMVFVMPQLEVGILKVMSDLSNNTKYRTTDRAFQDHNTSSTPTPLRTPRISRLKSQIMKPPFLS